jgi:hypothetical protein
MQCAVVDMQSQQGTVRPEVALIDTPVTLMLMDGKVDLRQELLDLRFIARPENVSPFTARSPILITGTFADPSIRPKAAPIAARVLGSIALAFVNPLAAIIPFLDPGTGEHSPCADALRDFNARNGRNKAASGTGGSGASGSGATDKQPAKAQPAGPDSTPAGQSVPAKPEPMRGIPGHGAD